MIANLAGLMLSDWHYFAVALALSAACFCVIDRLMGAPWGAARRRSMLLAYIGAGGVVAEWLSFALMPYVIWVKFHLLALLVELPEGMVPANNATGSALLQGASFIVLWCGWVFGGAYIVSTILEYKEKQQ